jgi:hypothetical protein
MTSWVLGWVHDSIRFSNARVGDGTINQAIDNRTDVNKNPVEIILEEKTEDNEIHFVWESGDERRDC